MGFTEQNEENVVVRYRTKAADIRKQDLIEQKYYEIVEYVSETFFAEQELGDYKAKCCLISIGAILAFGVAVALRNLNIAEWSAETNVLVNTIIPAALILSAGVGIFTLPWIDKNDKI